MSTAGICLRGNGSLWWGRAHCRYSKWIQPAFTKHRVGLSSGGKQGAGGVAGAAVRRSEAPSHALRAVSISGRSVQTQGCFAEAEPKGTCVQSASTAHLCLTYQGCDGSGVPGLVLTGVFWTCHLQVSGFEYGKITSFVSKLEYKY